MNFSQKQAHAQKNGLMYDYLVDLIGHIAYSHYKKTKIDYIKQRSPDAEKLAEWKLSQCNEQPREMYRARAKEWLEKYVRDSFIEKERELEKREKAVELICPDKNPRKQVKQFFSTLVQNIFIVLMMVLLTWFLGTVLKVGSIKLQVERIDSLPNSSPTTPK